VTIEELIKSLPNGLHDANLKSISVDFMERTIKMQIDLWVGDLSKKSEELREAYKSTKLLITGFDFCVFDVPDGRYLSSLDIGLTIDAGPGQPSTSPIELPPIPAGSFLFWIWVEEWNGFIRISAKDIQNIWI
jgi:hypothetical protein